MRRRRQIRKAGATPETMVIEFVATCLFGLEHFLGEEIDRLGYRRTETIDGRVSFIGDEAAKE